MPQPLRDSAKAVQEAWVSDLARSLTACMRAYHGASWYTNGAECLCVKRRT